ncbi:MAG: NAD(P)H-dependent oxidoreductase [Flavobacteriaceae bacterium]|nr:NAD(P)H-dependent oxidoreductase [Flavobacteriaceae bacterium]
MINESLISALEWRYAVKKFNPEKKISDELLNVILNAANLTATSLGAQPYHIVVVQNHLEKLKSSTFNQENIQTCSHLLILCHRTDVDEAFISEYVRHMERVRGLETGALIKYEQSCRNFISTMDEDRKTKWLAHQVYIVLGNLLTSCAILGVDSCPMEGFNAKLVDEILELEKEKLRSVLMLPIGYRADDDKYAKMEKVRNPLHEMVTFK